ncbi:MAG: DoxX family protein [Flavobacteriales bacterium]|nr:DoxX family protein [Flavobacteriales bacterium]
MNNSVLNFLADQGLQPNTMLQLAFGAMAAILFLQSGLDKLFNWKGEKAFLTGHFQKSILKSSVPLLLPVITLMELSAGSLSAIGHVMVHLGYGSSIGLLGMLLGTGSLIMLFFGQRVAKDYAGAAALVPYFLMCAAGVYVFTMA